MSEETPQPPVDPEELESTEDPEEAPDFGGVATEEEVADTSPDAPQNKMAWELLSNKGLMSQLVLIGRVVGRGVSDLHAAKEADKAGFEDICQLSVVLSAPEVQTLIAALNVIGFFSEEIGVEAKALLVRLLDLSLLPENQPTEERQKQYEEAMQLADDKKIAELLGVSVEELRQAVETQEAEKAAEEIDATISSDEDGPVLQ